MLEKVQFSQDPSPSFRWSRRVSSGVTWTAGGELGWIRRDLQGWSQLTRPGDMADDDRAEPVSHPSCGRRAKPSQDAEKTIDIGAVVI